MHRLAMLMRSEHCHIANSNRTTELQVLLRHCHHRIAPHGVETGMDFLHGLRRVMSVGQAKDGLAMDQRNLGLR